MAGLNPNSIFQRTAPVLRSDFFSRAHLRVQKTIVMDPRSLKGILRRCHDTPFFPPPGLYESVTTPAFRAHKNAPANTHRMKLPRNAFVLLTFASLFAGCRTVPNRSQPLEYNVQRVEYN